VIGAAFSPLAELVEVADKSTGPPEEVVAGPGAPVVGAVEGVVDSNDPVEVDVEVAAPVEPELDVELELELELSSSSWPRIGCNWSVLRKAAIKQMARGILNSIILLRLFQKPEPQ
jgi:hypothetical protein